MRLSKRPSLKNRRSSVSDANKQRLDKRPSLLNSRSKGSIKPKKPLNKDLALAHTVKRGNKTKRHDKISRISKRKIRGE